MFAQKVMRLLAIVIGTTLASVYSLPINAQINRLNNSNILENIETRDTSDWNFTGENEPATVDDDLKRLNDYDASTSDSASDVQLTEERPKWGNRGDVEDYSIEVEVYDY